MLTIECYSMFTTVNMPQLLQYYSNMNTSLNVVNTTQQMSFNAKK